MDVEDIKVEFEIGNSEDFSNLQCRACLSINRQLYLLTNDTELREVFLKICSFYEVPSNVYLCWECVSVLKKLVLFKNKVQYAESVLRSQLCDEIPLKSLTTLCISRVINTDTSEPIGEHGDVLVEVLPSEQIAQTDIKDEEDTPPETTIDDGMQFGDDSDEIDDNIDEDYASDTILKDVKEIDGKSKKNKKSSKKRTRLYKVINVGLKSMVKKVTLTEEEVSQWMEMERNSEIYKKLEKKCDLCLCILKKQFTLETHLKREHQKFLTRPHQCKLCKQYFSERNLSSHMKTHIGRVCSECGYECCTRYNMSLHIDSEHKAGVQCLDCNAKCGSPAEFYEHYKAYHTIFKCNDCEFETQHRKFLVNHIGRHHSVHRCDKCNKVFRKPYSYKLHIKLKHVVDRTEAAYCVQCNIQFDNEECLKRHIYLSKAHRAERNLPDKPEVYQCTECPNVYKSNISRVNHYRYVHTDTTRYYCEQCNRYFVNMSRLKDHRRRMHENYVEPKNKLCYICGRGFSVRRTLINHIRTHTGERPYECSLCDAKFAQKVALTVHMKHIHLKAKRKKAVKCL